MRRAHLAPNHKIERRVERLVGLVPSHRSRHLAPQHILLGGVGLAHVRPSVVDGVKDLHGDSDAGAARRERLVHAVLRFERVVGGRLRKHKFGLLLVVGIVVVVVVVGVGAAVRLAVLRPQLVHVHLHHGVAVAAHGDVLDGVKRHVLDVLRGLKRAAAGDTGLEAPHVDKMDGIAPNLGRVDGVQKVGRHEILDERAVLAKLRVRREHGNVVVGDDAAQRLDLGERPVKLLGAPQQNVLRRAKVGQHNHGAPKGPAKELHHGAADALRQRAKEAAQVAVAHQREQHRQVAEEPVRRSRVIGDAGQWFGQRLLVDQVDERDEGDGNGEHRAGRRGRQLVRGGQPDDG